MARFAPVLARTRRPARRQVPSARGVRSVGVRRGVCGDCRSRVGAVGNDLCCHSRCDHPSIKMALDRFHFTPETMSLDPPHFKKVVYLDQFVISEIVNAIDPHAKAHARVDPFWRQVFEALERVSKLQLVVCPWSPIHRDESLLSGRFERLQQMYEHLANGVRFDHPSDVEQRQLGPALSAWLDGKEPPQHDLNPERITNGGLHRWHGRIRVSVSMNHPPKEVRALRQRRRGYMSPYPAGSRSVVSGLTRHSSMR